MELQQLKNFQAVARCGNISKAARELYITQPSLSKSISRLEDELGVPLFTHRKGKIELNDYGKMFLSSIDIAFDRLSSGVSTIRRMYDTDQHILSLTSNISGFLPDNLPSFLKKYPEIGIRQRDSSAKQMTELILDRTVTLGISCEEIINDNIEFLTLGKKEYVLALSASHPLSANESVKVSQLKDETFICDSSRMSIEPLRKLCQKEGFSPNIGYEIENSDLIYNLVETGRGIAILPLGLCCKLLDTHEKNNVKLVKIDGELEPIIIGVCYHKNYEFSKAATLFLEFMKETLAKEDELIKKLGY
ncbi:MAG: LysR family transcriptional regulator [Eubacterium sp.]|nr:LysR family transcriptional regulator [Eubacterium sp.]